MANNASASHDDDFACPHCGADVAAKVTFCRECGASADSGWGAEDHESGALDDDDFDYDTYLTREFPDHPSTRMANLAWTVTFIVIGLTVLSVLLWSTLAPAP